MCKLFQVKYLSFFNRMAQMYAKVVFLKELRTCACYGHLINLISVYLSMVCYQCASKPEHRENAAVIFLNLQICPAYYHEF